jgi:hypothetical protein
MSGLPASIVDYNQGPVVLGVCLAMAVLATAAVGVRIAVRLQSKVQGKLTLGDWLIIISLVRIDLSFKSVQ